MADLTFQLPNSPVAIFDKDENSDSIPDEKKDVGIQRKGMISFHRSSFMIRGMGMIPLGWVRCLSLRSKRKLKNLSKQKEERG